MSMCHPIKKRLIVDEMHDFDKSASLAVSGMLASGNDFHLQRVNRMPKFKNWVYNGKRIKIIDTRISVPDSYVYENVFVSSKYYLAIWDKSMLLDVGSVSVWGGGEDEGWVVNCLGASTPH